ncbi:MAG TPA: hypothetical protein VF316_06180 [Polyangiaceae bacterium]
MRRRTALAVPVALALAVGCSGTPTEPSTPPLPTAATAPSAEPAPSAAPSATPSATPDAGADAVAYKEGLTGDLAEHARACDEGDTAWCMSVGNAFEFGADKDLPRAIRVYQKGCDGGDPGACANAGRLILLGFGAAMDADKALALFEKGCAMDIGRDTCAQLAARYEKGDGVKKDPKKAKEYWTQACEKKDAAACKKAGKQPPKD